MPKVMQNAMAKLYVRGNRSEAGEGSIEEVCATGRESTVKITYQTGGR